MRTSGGRERDGVESVTQVQDWELVTLMWWACELRQVMDGASGDGLDCDIRGLRDVVFDTYILIGWPRVAVAKIWHIGMPICQIVRMSTVKDLAELIQLPGDAHIHCICW